MSLLSAKNEGEAEDPTDERPQRAEGAQRVTADVVVDGQPTGGEPRHHADERADPAGGDAGERGADVVPRDLRGAEDAEDGAEHEQRHDAEEHAAEIRDVRGPDGGVAVVGVDPLQLLSLVLDAPLGLRLAAPLLAVGEAEDIAD